MFSRLIHHLLHWAGLRKAVCYAQRPEPAAKTLRKISRFYPYCLVLLLCLGASAAYGEAAEPHTDDFNTGERPIGGDPSMETNYGPYPEANNIFLLCYVESISHKVIVNAATGSKTSMTFYDFSRGTIISGVNNMGEPYQGEYLLSQLASKVEVPYMTPYSVSEVE